MVSYQTSTYCESHHDEEPLIVDLVLVYRLYTFVSFPYGIAGWRTPTFLRRRITGENFSILIFNYETREVEVELDTIV